MKISFSSAFNAAVLALAALSISSQAAALPVVLEKRGISGINNFACKLTPAHPRPLLLVHATLLNLDSWSTFAPYLIDEGYCVFALTYGRYNNIPIVGGLAPIENSAQELANFADNVLARMNASQVDYVGHSQGGILGRYWMKYLGGAGKVHRMVGIAPITHGTTLSGMATIAKALQIFDPSQPLFDSVAPSFFQMVESSDFMKKLNAGGDVAPGVVHSNIATRFDEVVTPWETCFQTGPGVTNVVLQDLCLLSLNEHLTIINSKVVLQFVLNQLSPATAKTANCLSVF